MNRFDLADPAAWSGPPSAHLLKSVAAVFVLTPLVGSVGLHRVWSDAVEHALASERQIASLRDQAAISAATQKRIDRLRSVLDGAIALRHGTSATLVLLPELTAHLQPGTRLAELLVDGNSVRMAGSAPTAGDISSWLSQSAQRNEALTWAAPEIHDAANGEGRIEFNLRIGRALPAEDSSRP